MLVGKRLAGRAFCRLPNFAEQRCNHHIFIVAHGVRSGLRRRILRVFPMYCAARFATIYCGCGKETRCIWAGRSSASPEARASSDFGRQVVGSSASASGLASQLMACRLRPQPDWPGHAFSGRSPGLHSPSSDSGRNANHRKNVKPLQSDVQSFQSLRECAHPG